MNKDATPSSDGPSGETIYTRPLVQWERFVAVAEWADGTSIFILSVQIQFPTSISPEDLRKRLIQAWISLRLECPLLGCHQRPGKDPGQIEWVYMPPKSLRQLTEWASETLTVHNEASEVRNVDELLSTFTKETLFTAERGVPARLFCLPTEKTPGESSPDTNMRNRIYDLVMTCSHACTDGLGAAHIWDTFLERLAAPFSSDDEMSQFFEAKKDVEPDVWGPFQARGLLKPDWRGNGTLPANGSRADEFEEDRKALERFQKALDAHKEERPSIAERSPHLPEGTQQRLCVTLSSEQTSSLISSSKSLGLTVTHLLQSAFVSGLLSHSSPADLESKNDVPMYTAMNFRKHLVDPWSGRKAGAMCTLTSVFFLVPGTLYEGRPLEGKGRADWLVRVARFFRERWTDIFAWNNLWNHAGKATDLILGGLADGTLVNVPFHNLISNGSLDHMLRKQFHFSDPTAIPEHDRPGQDLKLIVRDHWSAASVAKETKFIFVHAWTFDEKLSVQVVFSNRFYDPKVVESFLRGFVDDLKTLSEA